MREIEALPADYNVLYKVAQILVFLVTPAAAGQIGNTLALVNHLSPSPSRSAKARTQMQRGGGSGWLLTMMDVAGSQSAVVLTARSTIKWLTSCISIMKIFYLKGFCKRVATKPRVWKWGAPCACWKGRDFFYTSRAFAVRKTASSTQRWQVTSSQASRRLLVVEHYLCIRRVLARILGG